MTMPARVFAPPSCPEFPPAGACITSWKQASGDEVLYMRPDAVFDKSKPISGGIPHCFPQVGWGGYGGLGKQRETAGEAAGDCGS